MRVYRFLVILVAVSLLANCSAMKTAMEKRNLETQTKVSDSVFLEPMGGKDKTVYVKIRNTSSRKNLHLADQVENELQQKGYKIVQDPDKANYMLQANVLNVSRVNNKRADDVLANGYGGSVSGGAIGAVTGAAARHRDAPLWGGVAGTAAGMVADSAVKDVNYMMVTDVQLSQRPQNGEKVTEKEQNDIKQGSSSRQVSTSTRTSQWRHYRTRVTSTAEKMNLDFDEAKPRLEKELAGAVAGFF